MEPKLHVRSEGMEELPEKEREAGGLATRLKRAVFRIETV